MQKSPLVGVVAVIGAIVLVVVLLFLLCASASSLSSSSSSFVVVVVATVAADAAAAIRTRKLTEQKTPACNDNKPAEIIEPKKLQKLFSTYRNRSHQPY